MDFRGEYLGRLPLPLAQLYSRTHTAKDPRSRHDNAFYLCEALIKLAAAPLIASYLAECEQGRPRVLAIDRLLAQLALPSLGQWLGMLRALARYFAESDQAAGHPLSHVWGQLERSRKDLPGLLTLFRRIKNGPDGVPADDAACSLLQIFDALAQYRNAVFGHGGPRFETFFSEEMGPLFHPAVNELLDEGTFDYLGPRGSRLVYLTENRQLDEDRVELGLRELIGLQGERLAPLVLSRREAETLLGNRVALFWPGRLLPVPLDPLLVFRESETAEELLFLNRDRKGRQVEYLSYTTGRTERDRSMAPALAALLSRVVQRSVSDTDLRQLAEQSFAETPSVERLLAPEVPAGRLLADHELLAELGRGGMGVVYLARQQSLGRLVALKTLPGDLAGDEVALARFRREIRHLARCEHPNIIKVLSSGVLPEGQPYYTMEFVPGADLEHVWREVCGADPQPGSSKLAESVWTQAVLSASRKTRTETMDRASPSQGGNASADASAAQPPARVELPLPPLPEQPAAMDDETEGDYVRRIVALVRQAALALDVVHGQQIVHRDVKPANLMLTADGSRLVLMDFGLAKGQSLAMTASKQAGFLGTLRYAAPEQLASALIQVGPAADVRALGCVLWEFLTRQRLYGEAEDEAQLAARVLNDDVPSIRHYDPRLDRDLEAIVARATERDPRQRIANAGQLAEYLGLYLEGKPLPIRPPGTGEMVWRWVQRRKGLVSTVAAALVAIIVTVAVAFGQVNIARQAAEDLAKKNGELALNEKKANEQLTAVNQSLDDSRKEALGLAEKEGRARTKAEAETKRAEEEKKRKEEELRRAEALLYGSHIRQAFGFWRSTDLKAMRTSLDACRWDLRGPEHGYLARLASAKVRTLQTVDCLSLVLSRNARWLFSSSRNGVEKWDMLTGLPLFSAPAHLGNEMSLALSEQARQLFSAANNNNNKDRLIKVWDADSGQEIATLLGHTQGITGLVVSPDGKHLYSASRDQTIKVWDIATSKETLSWIAHAFSVKTLVVSADGKRLYSGGGEGAIKSWDPATGMEKSVLLGHKQAITSLALSPTGKRLYSASEDGSIRVWDVEAGKEIGTFAGSSGKRACLAVSPDGKTLFSGSDHIKGIQVWDLDAGRERQTLQGPSGGTYCMALSTDGRTLCAGSDPIHIWDLEEGKESQVVLRHDQAFTSLVWSPDGTRIRWGSSDGNILELELETGKVKRSFRADHSRIVPLAISANGLGLYAVGWGHDIEVRDPGGEQVLLRVRGEVAVLSPDGKRVYSSSVRDSKPIQVWDVDTGKELPSLGDKSNPASSLTLSGDGNRLFSVHPDRSIKVWDTASGAQTHNLRAHAAVKTLATSADGQRLCTESFDQTIKVWDVRAGKEVFGLRALRSFNKQLVNMKMSADGKRLFSTSEYENLIKVWDLEAGQELLALPGHENGVSSIALSPDGKQLASAGGPKEPTVRLWNLEASSKTRVLPGHDDLCLCLALTADGKQLFSGGGRDDPSVRVWDLVTGRQTMSLHNHADAVTSLALSADGSRLYSGSMDSTITVWNATTGDALASMSGHKYGVACLALSHNGKRLWSGGEDGSIKLWDVSSAKEIMTLEGHKFGTRAMVISPDGGRLFSGGRDICVKAWDAESGNLLFTLGGYTESVASLAISADGKRLFAGTQDANIKEWDLMSREEKRVFHRAGSLALAASGKLLFTGNTRSIKVWELETGKDILTLPGFGARGLALSQDDAKLIVPCTDNTIHVRDLPKDLRQQEVNQSGPR